MKIDQRHYQGYKESWRTSLGSESCLDWDLDAPLALVESWAMFVTWEIMAMLAASQHSWRDGYSVDCLCHALVWTMVAAATITDDLRKHGSKTSSWNEHLSLVMSWNWKHNSSPEYWLCSCSLFSEIEEIYEKAGCLLKTSVGHRAMPCADPGKLRNWDLLGSDFSVSLSPPSYSFRGSKQRAYIWAEELWRMTENYSNEGLTP